MKSVTAVESIEIHIQVIRGHRVILDSELSRLYGVRTSNLNTAVKRNKARFPDDFMFKLTAEEAKGLRLRIAASKGRGGPRYLPTAFTEQGIAMLSSVLKSERAIQVNIEIMRAFIRLKRHLTSHDWLREKVASLELKYDGNFAVVFQAIQKLLNGRN